MIAAFATQAAVREAQRSGKGRVVDISQWEVSTSLLGAPLLEYWFNGQVQRPMGNHDPMMAPHNVYPCKGEEHWVAISVSDKDEWQRFCTALENLEWARDARFSNVPNRRENQALLDQHVSAWTRERSDYEATETLQRHRVASFPSLSSQELFEDPHFNARGIWVEVDHAYGKETV